MELSCERIQQALSARLDGEQSGISDDLVDAHVAACAECQAFVETAAALNRQLNLTPVQQPVPDLSEAILLSVEPEFRRQAAARAFGLVVARTILVLLGLIYVVWAARLVLAAHGDEELLRWMMDAAAIRITLGFGLFFAAWRTDAMGGFFPLYGAMFTFSVGLHLREILLGMATWDLGAGLLLQLLSVVALGLGWLNGFGFVALSQTWRSLKAQPMR